MVSIITALNLPREFGITLLALTLVLALVPYFAGHDFGVVKVPKIQEGQRKPLRILGPVLLVLAVFLHVPVLPRMDPPFNSVAVFPFLSRANDAALVDIAANISQEVSANIYRDARLHVASPSSVRVMLDRDPAKRIGEELGVAAIVEGTISLADDDVLVVSPAIVYTANGYIIWTRSYCMKAVDAYETIHDVATKVATDVKNYLLAGAPTAISSSLSASEDASCKSNHEGVGFGLPFEEGTAFFERDATETLMNLAAAISSGQLASRRFVISGHVRPSGDTRKDHQLSEGRALAVKAALVGLGIEAARLDAVGLGSTEPVAPPNSTENNRVSIETLD
jgi:outer membrane protein OmpA-like peptidoglycan-associated protein